mmetsp:Transcript_1157/g.4135  ORF Transcript_1157/g.4135 Transcript_1157/m.4135 type:complete len:219 (+) Transcript_1157:283-939(+)
MVSVSTHFFKYSWTMVLLSTSFGEKIAGLFSAPLAVMTPAAPVSSMHSAKSSYTSTSPLWMMGTLTGLRAVISLILSQSAGSRGRMSRVLACTVMAKAPADSMIFMKRMVSCTPPSSRRILHDTGTGRFLASVATMSFARSGFVKRAAPMPPWMLNFLGQPMFTSMAATSPATIVAALRASTASAVPIWKTFFPCSLAHVLYVIIPSFLNSTRPSFSL